MAIRTTQRRSALKRTVVDALHQHPIVLSMLAIVPILLAVACLTSTLIASSHDVPIKPPFDETGQGATFGARALEKAPSGLFRVARPGQPSGAVAIQGYGSEDPVNLPLTGSPIPPSRVQNIYSTPHRAGRGFHVWFEVRGLFFTSPGERLAISEFGKVKYTARAVSVGSVWRIEQELMPAEVLDVRRLLIHGAAGTTPRGP